MILTFGCNANDQARHVSPVIPDDTPRHLHNENTGFNNLLFRLINTMRDSNTVDQIGTDFFFTPNKRPQIVSTDET